MIIGNHSSNARWLSFAAAVFLLALYTLFLGRNAGAYAGGSDSSGYLNNAKLLNRGMGRMPQRVIPGADDSMLNANTYIPLGFRPMENRIMAPTYPTGIPLMLVATARAVGWESAPFVLAIGCSLLGIVVTAWLAREFGLGAGWAWLAAALLAVTPTYLNMSLQLMSDIPAMIFSAAAVAFAWKSRVHPAWALAAGASFAGAVLVRPNDLMILIPLAICFGLASRLWVFFGLGGLPGAAFFCFYNRMAYGHPFETGYGNAAHYFTLSVIPATLANYAHWLPFALTPVGLLALGLPWFGRREPLLRNVLVAWIIAVLGFYSIDRDTQEGLGILRYLLPAFPAFLVGGVWGLKEIMRSRAVGNFFGRLSASISPVAAGVLIWAPAIIYSIFSILKFKHGNEWVFRCALPALSLGLAVVLGLKLARETDRGRALMNVAVSQLMMLMVLATLSISARLGIWEVRPMEIAYPNACEWANRNLPPGAVVYTMQTSGALLYYTPFTFVRWDFLKPAQQAEIERACAASGRPIYALLFPFEEDAMRADHRLDRWKKMATLQSINCWQLQSSAAIP